MTPHRALDPQYMVGIFLRGMIPKMPYRYRKLRRFEGIQATGREYLRNCQAVWSSDFKNSSVTFCTT
jgi:hypothetical protein